MTDTTIISTSELEHLKMVQAEYWRIKDYEVRFKCLDAGRRQLLEYLSDSKDGESVEHLKKIIKAFMGATND